jgi:tRNA U54 and U55 pseudouridine synthase Pus10
MSFLWLSSEEKLGHKISGLTCMICGIIIKNTVRHSWLTLVILATQEAEIRRIVVGSQPGQIVLETLSQKNPSQERAGGSPFHQGIGPELKPQY